ncbi:hypothetical protein [Methyloversatilis sp. XJ19-49]|uniref:hypothetical protein n=1 Tax=Methyloversatilis sp. XJ19-49 TaxID=2963429 RepID=UPI00211B8A48|nr:hypothetical protein [Methyloversatilis sp. XJ19-49]
MNEGPPSAGLLRSGVHDLLQPGDAAAFRAGEPLGHSLLNKSEAPAKVLVVGTRATLDRVIYPDHNRELLRDRSQPEDVWTDLQDNPAFIPYAD